MAHFREASLSLRHVIPCYEPRLRAASATLIDDCRKVRMRRFMLILVEFIFKPVKIRGKAMIYYAMIDIEEFIAHDIAASTA